MMIAEWQSKGGAHGVALRRTGEGFYAYRAHYAGGSFPAANDAHAVAYMESPAWPNGPRRVDLHQPDKNTTPMRRVS